MHTPLDPRQLRGLEIAATAKIVSKGTAWTVPSQSGKGRYTVAVVSDHGGARVEGPATPRARVAGSEVLGTPSTAGS